LALTYQGAFPVSSLIPGFGLWNRWILNGSSLIHLHQSGRTATKNKDDASLAGGKTGPDNDTELYGTKTHCR
jgi:hypothetical protein